MGGSLFLTRLRCPFLCLSPTVRFLLRDELLLLVALAFDLGRLVEVGRDRPRRIVIDGAFRAGSRKGLSTRAIGVIVATAFGVPPISPDKSAIETML
ncbi:hypothetical protein [Ensifer sp. SL37]|uniref:hypothetical protein n=1 Tax=Ensifer sp. SL37 TaxID=2995137 RepID=UPI002273FDEB|nr:hypothetical protein [Ensifer sp. SL37]MCY1740715.1 hypothetical protein [Ensifer sp. SL37]